MRFRRPVTAAVLVAAVLGLGSMASTAAAQTPERVPSAVRAGHLARPSGSTALEAATGLTMAITSISPAGLTPGQPLRLTGTVTNSGDEAWTGANVYLNFNGDAATTKADLESFGTHQERFGETINDLGRFDELGTLAVGSTTRWRLTVPFARLGVGAVGVYQVGATLLATNADGRDQVADARVATTVPYLPSTLTTLPRTRVVTLLAVTAPILLRTGGAFVDDNLAALISPGGRLRNIVDFAVSAPAGSVELVIDPALLSALTQMSDGYLVQSLGQAGAGIEGTPGKGSRAAASWLAELDDVLATQSMSLLPWGNPASSALADAGMPGVVEAAVVSSQRYALANGLAPTVTDWQDSGLTTRKGLAVSRLAGAATHVVSVASLPGLSRVDEGTYPPAQVSVNTRSGPVTAVVAPTDVGGVAFTRYLSALQLRQAVMAETTVRSLSETVGPQTMVVAAPFNWDPGPVTPRLQLASGYTFPTVSTQSLAALGDRPVAYPGKLSVPVGQPPLSTKNLDAIRRLRVNGRVYTELLTDHNQAAVTFDQQLATAGASTWRWQGQRGLGLSRELSRDLAGRIASVTVTGPAFVAMSSSSGRFPLTVTNGLDVPVTVKIFVSPLNKALKIAPIEAQQLDPGASRDIRVSTSASGSGLTQVRARLSTTSDRRFGHPFDFSVRATQIGLAIWVAMGVGLAALLISAARRIYRRARGQGFKTRAESGA